jgi:hypothetical protein
MTVWQKSVQFGWGVLLLGVLISAIQLGGAMNARAAMADITRAQTQSALNATGAISNTYRYLPLIMNRNDLPAGIYGRVLFNGTPIAGVSLDLRLFNGAAWSTWTTTTTSASGTYGFGGIPALTNTQEYYVRFQNTVSGNTNYLWNWSAPYLTTYTTNTRVTLADFDVTNIALIAPAPYVTLTLPSTFQWARRSAAVTDSYTFELFDLPRRALSWATVPARGYADSYTLTARPSGFSTGMQYGWNVIVTSPDGGFGQSYYYYPVSFAAGSPLPPELAPTRSPHWRTQDTLPNPPHR